MKIAIIAFLLSFLLNLIIIKHKEKFSKIIGDTDLFSPKKFTHPPSLELVDYPFLSASL